MTATLKAAELELCTRVRKQGMRTLQWPAEYLGLRGLRLSLGSRASNHSGAAALCSSKDHIAIHPPNQHPSISQRPQGWDQRSSHSGGNTRIDANRLAKTAPLAQQG